MPEPVPYVVLSFDWQDAQTKSHIYWPRPRAGYNLWDGGSIGWNVVNGSGPNSGRRLLASDSNYNVYSGASDNKTALQSQPSSDMQPNNSSDAQSNNTGSGQYMRVRLYRMPVSNKPKPNMIYQISSTLRHNAQFSCVFFAG